MTTSIYVRVTDAILAQIKTADPASWVCPWHRSGGGLPVNALTGRTYRGINILSLWCGTHVAGYGTNRWASYRQWSKLGAQVRRGETGTLVVFYKDIPSRPTCRDVPANDAESNNCPRFVARASMVFNAAQVDNWKMPIKTAHPDAVPDPVPMFDAFVANTGAIIRHEGHRAAYAPALDEIRMPPRAHFHSTEGYTATLTHELIHWTGAKHRLNRDLSTRFGSMAYAAEELVAELGSAFVLASLGLSAEPHPQHAAYIASWLPLLRTNPRALFNAAASASSATAYLQTLSHHACII